MTAPISTTGMPGLDGACRALAAHLGNIVPQILPVGFVQDEPLVVLPEPRSTKDGLQSLPAIYCDGRDMAGFRTVEYLDEGILLEPIYICRAWGWVRGQEYADTFQSQRMLGNAITAAIVGFPMIGVDNVSTGHIPGYQAQVNKLRASYSGISRDDDSRSIAACWVEAPIVATELLAYPAVATADTIQVTDYPLARH